MASDPNMVEAMGDVFEALDTLVRLYRKQLTKDEKDLLGNMIADYDTDEENMIADYYDTDED